MKKHTLLLITILCTIGLTTKAQNWYGKFQISEDPANVGSFLIQVVPDNDGTDEIAWSGTVVYLIAPDGMTYNAYDLAGTWGVSTLGNVPDVTSGCGDLIQATMNSDYNEADGWQAGEVVDLIRIEVLSGCNSDGIRFMLNVDPCAGIEAGGLDNGLQTGSNSGAYTGVLNGPSNPVTCSVILPVELISFTAQKENTTSLLNWATATETNNSHFEVQHSVNGIDFKTIGIIQSPNGNSNTVQNYNFTHQNPIQGNNYYRLKQVDFDGAFEYTDIKVVNFASESKLSLYPNPTKSELNINLPTDIENIVSVEVINSVGQVVRVLENLDNENRKKLKFQLNDLESGFYMIQVQTANQFYREQFIISK